MGKMTIKDIRSQIAWAKVTQSGVDTLTFAKMQTYVKVRELIAWNIDLIEWWLDNPTLALFADQECSVSLALCNTDTATDLDALNDSRILVNKKLMNLQHGTPGNASLFQMPWSSDLSRYKGGGLLVKPQNLYIGYASSATGAAGVAEARVHYTIVVLTQAEAYELLQLSAIDQ